MSTAQKWIGWWHQFKPHINAKCSSKIGIKTQKLVFDKNKDYFKTYAIRYSGVDVESQEAYDLASKGLLRPKHSRTPPQIYSIRCLEFDRPYFKLGIIQLTFKWISLKKKKKRKLNLNFSELKSWNLKDSIKKRKI